MTSTEDLHECQVSAGLELSGLVSALQLEVLDVGLVEGFLSGPFERFGPGLVAEPIADVISLFKY